MQALRTPFEISFKSSPDAMKLIALLYLMALYAIVISALTVLERLSMGLGLMGYYIYTCRRWPQWPYTGLVYHAEAWWLQGKAVIRYETLSLRLDTGLFVLMVLKNPKQRKVLVVFRDQLSPSQYRHLRLMECLVLQRRK